MVIAHPYWFFDGKTATLFIDESVDFWA